MENTTRKSNLSHCQHGGLESQWPPPAGKELYCASLMGSEWPPCYLGMDAAKRIYHSIRVSRLI